AVQVEALFRAPPDPNQTTPPADSDSGASASTPGPGARPPAAAPPAAPGRYQPVRFHARGGLGAVHLADDCELRRRVALKRIQPCHAEHPESRRRFLREAEITGRLEHPGIVPIYGLVHDADGQPWYAMRFIEGQSLKAAVARFHHSAGPAAPAPGDYQAL